MYLVTFLKYLYLYLDTFFKMYLYLYLDTYFLVSVSKYSDTFIDTFHFPTRMAIGKATSIYQIIHWLKIATQNH